MGIRKEVIEAAACNPRETTMSNHPDCEGLAECLSRPRWHVWWDGHGVWWVNAPGTPVGEGHVSGHHTYAEAINYAQKEATK